MTTGQQGKLIDFARRVLQTAFEGGNLDGGDIQELGLDFGLLIEEPFDPEKHGQNSLTDFEPGDVFYVYADFLKK